MQTRNDVIPFRPPPTLALFLQLSLVSSLSRSSALKLRPCFSLAISLVLFLSISVSRIPLAKPRHRVENTGSMLNQKRRAKKSLGVPRIHYTFSLIQRDRDQPLRNSNDDKIRSGRYRRYDVNNVAQDYGRNHCLPRFYFDETETVINKRRR